MCLFTRAREERRGIRNLIIELGSKITKLEDKVAWLSSALGGQTMLNIAGVTGAGSAKRDYISYTSPSGGIFVITWDQDYSPWSSGDRYLYIYKNGSLTQTLKVLKDPGGNPSGHYTGNPCCLNPSTGELFYSYSYGSGTKFYIGIYKYTFATDTVSSVIATVITLAQRFDDTADTGLQNCLAYDPVEDKMYLLGIGRVYSPYWYEINLWQLDNDGTVNHQVINYDYSGSTLWYPWRSRLVATNGYAYFYHARQLYGSSQYHYYCKIEGALVDQTSWTTTYSHTLGTDEDRYGIIGPWGLYIRYGATTLRSQNSATTWDLASYMDSDNHITVLKKTSANEDFEVLTRKATTVYMLALANAGTVTLIGSKAVDSDYGHHPEIMGQPFPGLIQDINWDQASIGSAKKHLFVSALTKDIT